MARTRMTLAVIRNAKGARGRGSLVFTATWGGMIALGLSLVALPAEACRTPDGRRAVVYDGPPLETPTGLSVWKGTIVPLKFRTLRAEGNEYLVVGRLERGSVGAGKQPPMLVAIWASDCSRPFMSGTRGYVVGRLLPLRSEGLRVILAREETLTEQRMRHQGRPLSTLQRR